jgi:hypothetical protein
VYHQTIDPKAGGNCCGQFVMIATKQPTDKEADVSFHHHYLKACTVNFISF